MTSLNYFTPAREDEVLWMGNAGTATGPQSSSLNGEETRSFYQSLIDEGDTRGGGRRAKRERRAGEPRRETHPGRGVARVRRNGQVVQASRQQANTTTELEGLRLLRCAQEGDLSGVRGLLSRGVDVNFQDGWWWTGLMCAAAAGQRGVVRLFLQEGAAWVGVVDTQGRDARELALRAGHHGVVEELDRRGAAPDDHDVGDPGQHRGRTQDHDRLVGGASDHNRLVGGASDHGDHSSPPGAGAVQTHQNQRRWCPECRVHYSCPQDTHRSSTLHLFSLSRSPPTPQYCLHPSTPAYRMMLRSGWTPGGGLGPEGEGPKQPVRTVLKRDSKGLGYGPTPRPKVTHFQAMDPLAVRRKCKERREGRGGRRREENRREERDRNWERDFRSSFNTFDP
ncbi:G patch domain and ankyrin repeat-containing protein 1 isoform X3 [Esox lucius]|uniref:G patch domain and ankyrin repeat-containing protein 1 isoform X3 n=1 Tax=Esox lucius TaxID=8010 RepID=UPI0010BDD68D|nr:G patch domain and ankyrin repeat-containing protein 1 isoform X3 [Esox lucius]XP_028977982.1 G patch domain and ankyrin repeat-containing protein 1 isoform X3 [Esox lucius]